MHPSHLIRATGAAPPCIKSLQASPAKPTLKHRKTSLARGHPGRAPDRHMSTSQPARHPLNTELGGPKSFQRLHLVNSPSFGPFSRSITSTAASQSPATALARLPSSQYIPRYDQAPLPRRQTLTAGETRKIDDMFSSIFHAVSRQEEIAESLKEAQVPSWTKTTRFSTKPVPVRWTRPGDDVLDMMKEEIEHCSSDQELYAWTLERLLGELDGTLSQAPATNSAVQPTVDSSSSAVSATPEGTEQAPAALPAFAYPQLLATVMRTFRIKYRDPHAALALFSHAQNASAVSYVTCCGTAAYNELIETKWDAFRDLQGVCDALEEMKLNKVRVDTRTTKLVESLRREVGQRNFWQDGFGESHTGVMGLLERIEKTCWPAMDATVQSQNRLPPPGSKWRISSEVWKRRTSNEDDRLEFV